MRKLAGLLDGLGTAYRLDLEGAEWVREVVAALAPAMDEGLGVLGYTYDARDMARPVIDFLGTSARFDVGWLPPFYAAVEEAGQAGPPEPTGFAAWAHLMCGQASAIASMRAFLPLFAHIGGSRDTFAVNALDAAGRGLWLGAPMRSTRRVSSEQTLLFTRLSAHLTAALRLRQRAASEKPNAAAVLSPTGALLHAERDDEAIVGARGELRRATLAFDEARTKKMRSDVEAATRQWRPLVASRWSLVDDFDTDGRRFVVAVENAPPVRPPRRELSEREHQVMTQALLGRSDKVIAYELGLAGSTVRVLLHRAMGKLGASNRREAVAAFAARTESAPSPRGERA